MSPHEAAERTVLGAVLVGAPLAPLAGWLSPQHFADPRHRVLWDAFLRLFERGSAIDAVTLRAEVGDSLDVAYLASLTDGLPRISSVEEWARLVRESARRRHLIGAVRRALERANDELVTADELAEQLQAALAQVSRGDEAMVRSIKSVLPEALAGLDRFVKSATGLTGVPTGLPWLDHKTGGLGKGRLVIVAGRPGRGKSTLLLQSLLHAATTGARVLVFSMEMPPAEHVERALLSSARLERWDLRTGGAEAWRRVSETVGQLQSLGIWYDTREAPTLAQIRARAREFQQVRGGLDLVVVDYLQRCSLPPAQDNWLAVGAVATGLKSLARALDVPVLCACQLNADAHEKRPNMTNLSSARSIIAAEADVIAFLHPTRPEAFDKTATPDVTLILEKQRGGPTGETTLVFLKHHTRFEELGPCH